MRPREIVSIYNTTGIGGEFNLKRWKTASLLSLGTTLGAWAISRHLWFRSQTLPGDPHWETLPLSEGDEIALAHIEKGHRDLCVVAHGFLKRSEDGGMVTAIEKLSQFYDVLTFDFPGHGRSSGYSRLSFREGAHCLRQVLDRAQGMGYDHVAVVGYSMGAAAGILAASNRPLIDALVSVSCPVFPPSDGKTQVCWPTWPWRWWARLMGIQLADQLRVDVWPIERVEEVSPTPLLIVHHQLDTLVSEGDSRTLYDLAREPKDYLQVARAPHAHAPASIEAIIAWLRQTLKKGSQ